MSAFKEKKAITEAYGQRRELNREQKKDKT